MAENPASSRIQYIKNNYESLSQYNYLENRASFNCQEQSQPININKEHPKSMLIRLTDTKQRSKVQVWSDGLGCCTMEYFGCMAKFQKNMLHSSLGLKCKFAQPMRPQILHKIHLCGINATILKMKEACSSKMLLHSTIQKTKLTLL